MGYLVVRDQDVRRVRRMVNSCLPSVFFTMLANGLWAYNEPLNSCEN